MSSLEMIVFVGGMWFVVRPLGNYLARRAEQNAAITPLEEERLTTVFELLGDERVAQGLTAGGHDWNDCFLAHATGGYPFGLRPALLPGWRQARRASLSPDLTRQIVRTWDRKEPAFRSLATDWLAARRERGLRNRSRSLRTAPIGDR